MAETIELLPCPFCGEHPGWLDSAHTDQQYIGCTNDECFGPCTTAVGDDAVVQWNARATASQSTERDRVLEEAAQRAEAEPEFPDEPSDEVLAAMQSVHPIENARAACRATKKAIAAAIRAMKTSAAAHTRSNAADMEG